MKSCTEASGRSSLPVKRTREKVKHQPQPLQRQHIYLLMVIILVAGSGWLQLTRLVPSNVNAAQAAVAAPRQGFTAPEIVVTDLNDQPLALISPQGGTFSWTVSFLNTLPLLAGHIWKKKLPRLPFIDALACGVALFLPFYSLGNLAAGDAFGLPTNLPWGITLWEANRQLTQIYLFLATLILLGVLCRRRRLAGNGWQALILTSQLRFQSPVSRRLAGRQRHLGSWLPAAANHRAGSAHADPGDHGRPLARLGTARQQKVRRLSG